MPAEFRPPADLMEGMAPDFEFKSFDVYKGENILYMREPEWLLEGCIQRGGTTIIYGDPGSGKSLLAISWAMMLSRPDYTDWAGFERRRQVKVAYIVGEGQGGIPGRVNAWLSAHEVDEVPPVYWIPSAVPLWRSPGQGWQDDQADLRHFCWRERIDVLFVDTLAMSFGAGNENQQQDMNMFLQTVASLQNNDGHSTAVVIVHHESKSGDMRGSTVLRGFADTVIHMKATVDGGSYKEGHAEMDKQKDGRPWGRKIFFTPVRTDSSLTIVPVDEVDRTGNRIATEILTELGKYDAATWEHIKGNIRGKAVKKIQERDMLIERGQIVRNNDGTLSVVQAENVERLGL